MSENRLARRAFRMGKTPAAQPPCRPRKAHARMEGLASPENDPGPPALLRTPGRRSAASFVYWDALNAVYEKWTRPAAAQETADADSEFWCPMHPTIVRDHPDKCPICGMPLSKRKKGIGRGGSLAAGRPQPRPAHALPRRPGRHPDGDGGLPAADQGDRGGRLRRVRREQTDAHHEPHQRQQPHRQALRQRHRPDGRRGRSTGLAVQPRPRRHHAEPARRPPRRQQAAWSNDPRTAPALGHRRRPDRHSPPDRQADHARDHPLAGKRPRHRKYQLEGDYIDEGARLFDVADLSTVWIEAQVFEDELAFLKKDLVVHAYPQGVSPTANSPASSLSSTRTWTPRRARSRCASTWTTPATTCGRACTPRSRSTFPRRS